MTVDWSYLGAPAQGITSLKYFPEATTTTIRHVGCSGVIQLRVSARK
jgi:hypothetical protein